MSLSIILTLTLIVLLASEESFVGRSDCKIGSGHFRLSDKFFRGRLLDFFETVLCSIDETVSFCVKFSVLTRIIFSLSSLIDIGKG